LSNKYFMELPIKVQAIIYRQSLNEIEYLMIKRREEDGGFWQSVTGTLEEGEFLAKCMQREIQEEIGVSEILSQTGIIYTYTWRKSSMLITEYVYGIEVSSKTEILLSFEHSEYQWCSFSKALDLLIYPENKKALQILQNLLEKNKKLL